MQQQHWQGDSLYKTDKRGRYKAFVRVVIQPVPDVIRFWSKVLVGNEGCWEWQASLSHGYAAFAGGYAHAWIAKRYLGERPPDKEVDHICRNPKCVRPSHLRFVTHRDNLANCNSIYGYRIRQTHCKNGHLLGGNNVVKNCGRACKICMYKRNAEAKRERRLARRLLEERQAPQVKVQTAAALQGAK